MARHGQPSRAFDAASVRAEFPILSDPGLHYLDNAAIAQIPTVVLDAMGLFDRELRANVHGGVYRLACGALAAYESARAAVARFIHAQSPAEVVFTYGTTSAINLLAHSFGALLQEGDEVLISQLEHHSNLLPWRQLAERRGVVLRTLPMTQDGRLDLDRLEETLRPRCRLVALTHCSNVTGALTDVDRVVAAARAVGAKVMLDGAQRLPHGAIDVQALGIDFYVFSGHKCYGPTGIGVLWGKAELLATMPPFMTGGQMIRRVTAEAVDYADPPRRLEAGTPPIGPAIGLGAALEWMARLDWDGAQRHERRLTQRVLARLAELPGVRVVGPLDLCERIGVVSFDIAGIDPTEVCRALDRRHGVALRAGYHCAQPLVAAFGLTGVARASLAPYSTDADVDALLEGLDALASERCRLVTSSGAAPAS
ncbi:MAG: cysteine desulfurase [Proteobacteria bacterium]|nr:cysteine desulfurase [Pseudomonadota bacterium]